VPGSVTLIRTTARLAPLGPRSARFVVWNHATPDRNGRDLAADGWVLEPYQANPVLLWNHDDDRPPIGRASSVSVRGKRLIADLEFLPERMDPFADHVAALFAAGYLSAASAGWVALESPKLVGEGDSMRLFFPRNELAEISIVPVPAHRDALRLAASLQCSETEIAALFAPAPAGASSPPRNRFRLALARASAARLNPTPARFNR